MFKNIRVLLTTLTLAFYAINSFAINPGAGQAQIQNSMQEMQKSQKRMQNMQKNQQMMQQKPTTPQRTPRKQTQ